MTPLEDHLQQVIQGIHSAESLDDLMRSWPGSAPEHADYLLSGRRVVAELKSLEDTRHSVLSRVFSDARADPSWVPICRDMDWLDVVRLQPHGPELQQRVTREATKHLRNIVRKGHRQIRSTKATLRSEDAQGLLIVLNGEAPVLNSKVVLGVLSELVCQRTTSGALRYPSIDAVLLLSPVDLVVGADESLNTPCFVCTRLGEPLGPAAEVANTIIADWTESLGKSLQRLPDTLTESDLAALPIQSTKPWLEA